MDYLSIEVHLLMYYYEAANLYSIACPINDFLALQASHGLTHLLPCSVCTVVHPLLGLSASPCTVIVPATSHCPEVWQFINQPHVTSCRSPIRCRTIQAQAWLRPRCRRLEIAAL